ncbi:MAG: DUF1343 domain-containing protein [Vallitaleaceae bacterium]|jgi:uncharacterized protein YbbC (DUF1343 family)/CubicO group peptidase (beta-lactamase class C family)|nr:DUF1343 domain-containing protein [Vallitaleaceae bacterium]
MLKSATLYRITLTALLALFILAFTSCKSKNDDLYLESVTQIIEAPLPVSFTDTHTFYHYKNGGTLFLSATQEIDINLSVNNVSLGNYTIDNNPLAIDVSTYTIDGINTLLYSYETISEIDITISQDYPVLADNYIGTAFTDAELSSLTSYIESEIDDGFPGAVLLIAHKGQIAYLESFGYAKMYDGLDLSNDMNIMEDDTLFDLASLTKSFSTTLGIMTLEQSGSINSSDTIGTYETNYNTSTLDNITINHFLTHTSGYNASFRFFDPDNTYGEDFYSLSRIKTLELLSELPLSYATGSKSVYSDLGYMILGGLIEDVSGQSLDQYVKEHVYDQLGLTHTLYKPLTAYDAEDIAATERAGNTRDLLYEWPGIRTYTLQGEVHDELAYYSMNEISGNAGLFSNAMDLAVLSQTLLNLGGYGDTKLFDSALVTKYTTPSNLYNRYTLGFDYASHPNNYSRYGMLVSDTAYGKTGWTGTCVLIDPTYDLTVVLLTNKRHASYESGFFDTYEMQIGRYSPIITKVYELLLDEPSYQSVVTDNTDQAEIEVIPTNTVTLGIDRLGEYMDLFDTKKVGLITNMSAQDTYGRSTVDVFLESLNVTALFAPEHGFESTLSAGEIVDDERLEDIPIYSLYGNTIKPTSSMLGSIDLLAFDLQDVGTRYYTYIYTMIESMKACADNNIPFVVFDRPNIYGKQAYGNEIEPEYESFVGDYGLRNVYGLTIGELANYINDTYRLDCDLTVIPMTNYVYQNYVNTGLEFIGPSPNMNTIEAALLYPGICLIEGTNISEGRGTTYPFQMIGAPFINPYVLADRLNQLEISGVHFKPISFFPSDSKEADRLCFGVFIEITDIYTIDPIEIGISLLYTLQNLYGSDITYTEHLNALAGLDLTGLLESDIELDELQTLFDIDDAYYESLEPYYLYD